MLLVFLLFESFPNALAELTLFGDREFYQDWWNATSIEEFYGRWLRISYLFYYRHVYMDLQLRYKMSPEKAKAITNLVSSFMQELIMVRLQSVLILNPILNTIDNEFPSVWFSRFQSSNSCHYMVFHLE